MTEADMDVIRGNNELTRKRYAQAAEAFNRAAREAPDPDAMAEALYGLQQAEFDQGHWKESVDAGNRVVALTPAREKWTVPFAWLKIGQAKKKLGAREEARQALRMVGEFSGYDYQKGIERDAEEEMQDL